MEVCDYVWSLSPVLLRAFVCTSVCSSHILLHGKCMVCKWYECWDVVPAEEAQGGEEHDRAPAK